MVAGLRILLAEDDPVSRSFLEEVLATAGSVVAVADGTSALAAARTGHFDVLVLDQNLPDMGGSDVLAALRGATGNASPAPRAVALSAGLDEACARALRGSGFDAALAKPIDASRLLDCVNGATVDDPQTYLNGAPGVLDDTAALRALGGNPATVARLRGLFAGELPLQLDAIRGGFEARDAQALAGQLHRLQASCGFCGAPELALAGRQLAQSLQLGRFSGPDLDAFMMAARRLLATLVESDATDPDS